MSVEASKDARLVQIVEDQVTDFAQRFGKQWWPGFEREAAGSRLGYYIDVLIGTYSTGDKAEFFRLSEQEPAFEDVKEIFNRNIAVEVGVPFPSAGADSKLEIAEAAKRGHDLWKQQERNSS